GIGPRRIGSARSRRALSVQRIEAGLPRQMPQSVRDPVLALEQQAVTHLSARNGARGLVPRLLLGGDAGHVRGRRHEHFLDGADRALRRRGETVGQSHPQPAGGLYLACMGRAAHGSFVVSASEKTMAEQFWAMTGELVLSCNCTVFCPCVLSLGNHP